MATKKRAHKTSKGERSSISNGVNLVKRHPIDVALSIHAAWKAGKNPWMTVEGPEKNKPFIRVRSNDLLGDHRRRPQSIYGGNEQ